MSERTKERAKIVALFIGSCLWHVAGGLYEYIVYVGGKWVEEWEDAKKEWDLSSLLGN